MNQRLIKLGLSHATSTGMRDGRARTAGGADVRPPVGRFERRGFTLIELLVVMAIIGIVLGFVLVAGMDAANRANERATQSLITKLEQGLNDRLEALLQTRPDYTQLHFQFANVYYDTTTKNNFIPSVGRAQVIAWVDYIKAEIPDVFFVQNTAPGATGYPLNFAGNPIPGGTAPYNSMLPLGAGTANPPGTGIYGASYTAAAGIYKNLGYLPGGYDGVDNDADGFVDNYNEGVCPAPKFSKQDQTVIDTVTAHLTNHKHTTARSEMLYALLIEGNSPLGTIFNRDDFTDKEVQDTDGDGLPEFVDAWGQPLQFYRWPLLYHSDIQRGQVVTPVTAQSWTTDVPYGSVYQSREQDPLDLNQQLMAPAWWTSYNANPVFTATTGASYGSITPTPSTAMQSFEYFFHKLTEPYTPSGTSNFWDRSAGSSRRAFYSKFLIVSGGPDQLVGIFRYSDTPPTSPTNYIANENNALPFDPSEVVDFTAFPSAAATSINSTATPNSFAIQQAAQDDISNQNLAAAGVIGGSG